MSHLISILKDHESFYASLKYFKDSALDNINTIEELTKAMFHVAYPNLAIQHNNAMNLDSISLYKTFKYKTDRLIDQLRST